MDHKTRLKKDGQSFNEYLIREYENQQVNPIKVFCGECQEWFTQDKVQTTNIEEDYMGRDILTFECPECKSIQKSLRIG